MVKIYAELNGTMQQVGGDMPTGWIEMNGFRPDGDYIASETGEWVLYAPTLEEAREAKLQAWKEYDAEYRQTGTVEVDGKFFSISNDAKINLTAVSLMAVTTGLPITYYQKNGVSETYTTEEFTPLSIAIATGINNAETNYYAIEAQINNATSIEELNSITWISE